MKYVEINRTPKGPASSGIFYRDGARIRPKELNCVFDRRGVRIPLFDEIAEVPDSVADDLVYEGVVRVVPKAKAKIPDEMFARLREAGLDDVAEEWSGKNRIVNDWEEQEIQAEETKARARWDLVSRKQVKPTPEELDEMRLMQESA